MSGDTPAIPTFPPAQKYRLGQVGDSGKAAMLRRINERNQDAVAWDRGAVKIGLEYGKMYHRCAILNL